VAIEPVWIGIVETLAIHDRLLALNGGPAGVRDRDLLDSALARPRRHWAHGERVGIVDRAAIYTSTILRNQPFVDGNKITSFIVGVLFLELNGFSFAADEAEAATAVLALAAGSIDEAAYAGFLESNTRPAP
jgi:death-on-curing protein